MRIIALIVATLLALTGCAGERSEFTLTVRISTSAFGPADERGIEPVEHVFENVAPGQKLDIEGGIGPDEAIVKRISSDGITLELSEPLTSSFEPFDRSGYLDEIDLRTGEPLSLETPSLDTVSRYEFRLEA